MGKIPKEEAIIVAYAHSYKIKGTIFMPPGCRISDYLSTMGQKKFISIADAVITDISGNEICKTEFLSLNIDNVIFMTPASEIESK